MKQITVNFSDKAFKTLRSEVLALKITMNGKLAEMVCDKIITSIEAGDVECDFKHRSERVDSKPNTF